MKLDELKNSMACLDRQLAADSTVNYNMPPQNNRTAQSRIYNNYLKSSLASLILAAVYLITGFGGSDTSSFPQSFRLFLGVYLFIAGISYIVIAVRIKQIDLTRFTPLQTAKSISSFRKLVIVIETVMGAGLIVFFTLFLAHLTTVAQYKFWIVLGSIAITITLGILVYLPRKIRDFKDCQRPI